MEVVCPKCSGPVWDNREKKTNPKAPDYKCKDKENCDGVIWPPRGKAAPQAQAARGNVARSNGSDDRSNRIERQHSQEMAIRWITLLTTLGVLKPEEVSTPKKLRETIDFFQLDVGRTALTGEQLPDPADEEGVY